MKEEAEFKLYGIFGHPLSHTLSPAMQEAAFSSLGIRAYYLSLELDLPHFRKVMQNLSRMALHGFNLTVPYKEVVLPYLDSLTPEAKALGAVNTVFRRGPRWIGANTDVYGFLTSLKKQAGFHPRGKKILILGAGGAARAVVYGLAKEGVREIQIANRHAARAGKIVRQFRKIFRKTAFGVLTLKTADLKKGLEKADLVVNATSLGLKTGDPLLIPAGLLRKRVRDKRLLFYDLIYYPTHTRFLETARKSGHRVLGGLGMLLFQGCRAFEYWTGKRAPVAVMRAALNKALKEREK